MQAKTMKTLLAPLSLSFSLLLLLPTLTLADRSPLEPLPYQDRFHAAARARAVQMKLSETPAHARVVPEAVRQLQSIDPDELRAAVEAAVVDAQRPDAFRKATLHADNPVGETPEEYATCINNTASILVSIQQEQQWALLMLDAMGKPVPGFLQGNTYWLGSYSLCQMVKSNVSAPYNPDFEGKYCNAYSGINLPVDGMAGYPVTLAVGMCVPSTCSEYDMTYLLNDVMERLQLKPRFGVSCPPVKTEVDTKAAVAIVVCAVLALCMLGGTAVDVMMVQMPKWRREEEEKNSAGGGRTDEHAPLLSKSRPKSQEPQLGVGSRLLLSFSVYTNASKLLSTSQPPGSLTCVHGIRFFSMTWVVLGHSFMYQQGMAADFGPFYDESIHRWTFQAICNALVSVDTFFVLSGLLVAYLTLREMKKREGKLNWFMFYFHRFWRLTPAYMLVIMVYVCFDPYWGEGPLWSASNPDRDNCEDVWWSQMLYVNNLVKTDKTCLGQSWYLANDMQFYCVLSPLVLVPLFFAPLWGVIVAVSLILAHCITNGALTAHYKFPPGIYAQIEETGPHTGEWFDKIYIKPWARWGPYVIGMLAGWFLYLKDCKLNIRWPVNLSIWAVASGSAVAVLYGLYGASTGHPVSVSTSAFYNAMHRNVWGACVAWVIVACVTGNGGFVNTLLSWKAFVPLSRLTYTIYLLHMIVMNVYAMNQPAVFHYSDINIVMFFLAVLVVSYGAAFVTSLAFEAPMMALEKVVFNRGSAADTKLKPGQDGGAYQNGYSKQYMSGQNGPYQNGHTSPVLNGNGRPPYMNGRSPAPEPQVTFKNTKNRAYSATSATVVIGN